MRQAFTPAKNRFGAHEGSLYLLATELTHPSEAAYHAPSDRGPTLRYCPKPAHVAASEKNGDASGSATSSAFRDVTVEAGYVVYNVGDSVFFNDIRNLDQTPMDQLQLRQRPSSHDVAWTPSGELEVCLGFATGEIMSYQPLRKDIPTTLYSRGSFESTSAVTDIRWAPGRPGCFVAAHAHGTLLVYDTRRLEAAAAWRNLHGVTAGPSCADASGGGAGGGSASAAVSDEGGGAGASALAAGAAPPAGASGRRAGLRRTGSNERRSLSLFRSAPVSTDERSKAQAGPSACWHICQSAINQLDFSHTGRYLAMVSADGLLRVFLFATEQLLFSAHSYYAGLLCVAWSPDDAYLITGGEDDLVSVWSFDEQRLLARAAGHSSWVTCVQFDPYAPGAAAAGVGARVGVQPRGAGSTRASGVGSIAEVSPCGHGCDDRGSRPIEPLAPSSGAGRTGARARTLAFGSVGMDAKLLLWEMEVDEPSEAELADMRSLQLHAPVGAPVSVLHARGARAGERAAGTPNGKVSSGVAGSVTARIARLPASPVTHEPQFSVDASPTGVASTPIIALSGRGDAAGVAHTPNGRGLGSEHGFGQRSAAKSQLVLPAPPLTATPVLKPIGGVTAHAEPATHLAFTQSCILTTALDGHVRVWIPRVPPGPALHAESATPALTFNLVTINTTPQHAIYASSKLCHIDPVLTAATLSTLREN